MNKKLDIATVVGYIGAFGALIGGLLSFHGGSKYVKAFFELAAGLIVFVGAFFAVVAQFPLKNILNLPKVILQGFFEYDINPQQLIIQIVKYAEIARKEGILALEKTLDEIKDPFLKKGIQYAIDGTPPETLEKLLLLETEYAEERHHTGAKMVEQLATLSPAFGLIGTATGLILTLLQLDDPSKVGPSMAASLLSTLYGVFACYAIYTPIQKKLEKKTEIESFFRHLIIKGLVSIQSGDNPRIIEEKLKAFLSDRERNFSTR
jgi:chemotaxis protein MotA